jgi:hypothetical protein
MLAELMDSFPNYLARDALLLCFSFSSRVGGQVIFFRSVTGMKASFCAFVSLF